MLRRLLAGSYLGHEEETRLTARVEDIAWELLVALNRLQAKGSRVRIVVPRDPVVTRELGLDDPNAGATNPPAS